MENVRDAMGYDMHSCDEPPNSSPNSSPVSRGLGASTTDVSDTSLLRDLSREQLIKRIGLLGNATNNSSCSTSSIASFTLRQNAMDKKLDRAIRDMEAKASDLARFRKADYAPLTESTVDKYNAWRKRFITQLTCHGLAHLLNANYKDHFADIVGLSCDDGVFDDQPALLEKYEYLINRIDELVNKQMTFVKTVFEDVFQDSLASKFVKMSECTPHEIWSEIDNAFTTVTLNKSANAVKEFTNFTRNQGEGLRQFLLRMETARKSLHESYGHKVSDLEMIPKLEAGLSGELLTAFITWCGLRGTTYKSLRQQLWDRGDDLRATANVSFNDGFRPRRHPHATNHSPSTSHITTIGPKVLAAIQGGGGQPIEGGEGVGEDGLSDRPIQVLTKVPY